MLSAVRKSETPESPTANLKFPDENPDLEQTKVALRDKRQLMLDEIKDKGYTIQHFHNVDEATVKYLHVIASIGPFGRH